MAASGPQSSSSSSPRLPSPPPIAEDQTGPQSPLLATSEDHGRLRITTTNEQAADRRIRPGTKSSEMADGPPLIPLADIDSAFQLNEHLKALHHSYTHPDHLSATIPMDRSTAATLAEPPEGIDRTLWLYELCRFLVQKVNAVIVTFFADTPPCSANTCPEMRASEWQYLCAVHDPPKACCAIDYCCHTLDWAANTLTSPKHFLSRLTLGGETAHAQHQVRQLTSIFRRVYRIFAHAWFQHREMFWRVEGKTGLYILFKTVCDVYELIPPDNYTIPPEAEGKEPEKQEVLQGVPSSILKRAGAEMPTSTEGGEPGNDSTSILPTATARRHRPSPSTGSNPVTTVIEETEEEDEPSWTESVSYVPTALGPVEAQMVEQPPNLSESTLEGSTKSGGTSDSSDYASIAESRPVGGEVTPSALELSNSTSYFSSDPDKSLNQDVKSLEKVNKGSSAVENAPLNLNTGPTSVED